MDFTLAGFIQDFAIMSGLMILSMILRAKIKFFQNFYVPVAMIAGIIGIIGGKYVLNIIPFSSQASSYSGFLFYFLFATLFIGKEGGKKTGVLGLLKRSGDSVCLNNAAYAGFYGVAAMISASILIAAFPSLNSGFGVLAATGFAGGHGSAAAVGAAFVNNGWEEGLSVAQTFATIGLLCGIFGGVGLIKMATKRKYTKIIDEVGALPEDMKTGLIRPENREAMATETVNTMSIDSLTWHTILVVGATGAGMAFNAYVVKKLIPGIVLPDHIFTLVCGALLFLILSKVGLGDYVDKQCINRIGSTVTDYLVAFGVATINLNVVLDYWLPLLIMSLVMLGLNLVFLFVISRDMFHNYWFERGIYIYGMCTGVAATGILLLRIVDPEYKTKALEDIGVAMIVMAPIDIVILSMTPIMFVQGMGLAWGAILTVFAAALLIISKVFFNKQKLKEFQ